MRRLNHVTLPAPPDAEFERYVRETLAGLPAPIAAAAADVLVRVMDFADRETLHMMEIDNPYDLLGLYHGVSLDHKSVFDVAVQPDMVFIYRQPILAYAEDTGQRLEDVVRHVVIHEIGHHFGFSDDDMHYLEHQADAEDEVR